jgi:hypothetical protein
MPRRCTPSELHTLINNPSRPLPKCPFLSFNNDLDYDGRRSKHLGQLDAVFEQAEISW